RGVVRRRLSADSPEDVHEELALLGAGNSIATDDEERYPGNSELPGRRLVTADFVREAIGAEHLVDGVLGQSDLTTEGPEHFTITYVESLLEMGLKEALFHGVLLAGFGGEVDKTMGVEGAPRLAVLEVEGDALGAARLCHLLHHRQGALNGHAELLREALGRAG